MSRGRGLFLALAVTLPIAVCGLGSSLRDDEVELRAAIPELSDELVEMLTGDVDRLTSYCLDKGPVFCRELNAALRWRVDESSLETFSRTRAAIEPALDNLAIVLDRLGVGVKHRATLAYERELTREELYQRSISGHGLANLKDDCAPGPDREVTDKSTAYWALSTWRRARCAERNGDAAEQDRLMQEVFEHLPPVSQLRLQFLGELGSVWQRRGRSDLTVRYWNEGLELALDAGITDQAARLTTFLASHHRANGRFALAADLFEEACRLCGETRCGSQTPRFVARLTEFYADIGAWSRVRELLERAELSSDAVPEIFNRMWLGPRMQIDRVRARLLMAEGRVDEGNALFRAGERRMAEMGGQIYYAQYLWFWAVGLTDNGRADEALALLDQALEIATTYPIPGHLEHLRIARAEAFVELGRFAEAAAELDRYEALAPTENFRTAGRWIAHDRRRAQLARSRGDFSEALAAVEIGRRRILEILERADGSALSYVMLSDARRLQDELLRLPSSDDPRRSYLDELEWRALPSAMGDRSDERASSISRVPQPIDARRDVHLLYSFGERVTRWVTDRDGTRRTTLAIEADELARRIDRALQSIVTEGDRYAVELRSLAQLLLPEELRSPARAARYRRIWVTADGALEHLPYEALDLAEKGEPYYPLSAVASVANLRPSFRHARSANAQAGLAIIDPATDSTLLRRHPGLRPLRGAHGEASALVSIDPDLHLLQGPDATRKRLVSRWSDAGYLYLATHVVRDPESPHLTFVPLASSGLDRQQADSYLDVHAIRAADLRRCALVVLSGCASGVPWIHGERTAPSLGDAFLDAGAHAVVETNWAVEDDRAASLMTAFIEHWQAGRADPIDALDAARREAMGRAGKITHPREWAGFSVQLRTR